MDAELNVVPAVARSWQVLDEGRRYLFHLRDDVTWTDGKPVSAVDFEWAWKRNLDPALHSVAAEFLFDILGARAYHEGKESQANSVGVRALDELTLEVRLEQPVAYFPFIVTLPVAFPLPRLAIETFGDTWCQPGHIVSNGPYHMVEFDPQTGAVIERNPGYYGGFPGNAGWVEWEITPSWQDRCAAYMENRLDFTFWNYEQLPVEIPDQEVTSIQESGVFFAIFSPVTPPLEDVRVRKALCLTLDKQVFARKYNVQVARGGLVPPGLPGHSPDIALPFDPEQARKLMAQAGYPDGRGFPALRGVGPAGSGEKTAGITQNWREALGVEICFDEFHPWEVTEEMLDPAVYPIFINGWLADYPDPDNFLRNSEAVFKLRRLGWHDPAYDRLVEQAARTPDRARRMAMYRQADRLLVEEQALVLPLYYNTSNLLVKPWVKNFRTNALGFVAFQNVLIEEH
jgi:oligopeptide transport system substrate-binding protein